MNKAMVIGVAGVLSAGAGLGFSVEMARNLTVGQYGILSGLLALIATVVPIGAGAIGQVWVREKLSRKNAVDCAPDLVVLGLRSISATFLVVLVIVVSFGLYKDVTSLLLASSAVGLSVVAACLVELSISISIASHRLLVQAILMPAHNVLRLLSLLIMVLLLDECGVDPYWPLICAALPAIFLALYVTVPVVRQELGVSSKQVAAKRRKLEISSSVKDFAKIATFQTLYYQADMLMMPVLSSAYDAGKYATAFITISMALLVPSVITQRLLLPKYYLIAATELRDANAYIAGLKRRLELAGFLVCGLFILLAESIISVIFGSQYVGAHVILQVSAISIPFIYGAFASGLALTVQNGLAIKVKCLKIAASLNIVLNLIAIPLFGAIGAAITTVVCSVVVNRLYANGARKVGQDTVFNARK